MSCKHVDAAELRPPTAAQSVYREDCTQCFDSIDDLSGLNVCLYCFNGGCTAERNHARLHWQVTKHPLVLNIQRTRKNIKRNEPPQKISKLAVVAETEEDRYDTRTKVLCYECGVEDVETTSGKLPSIVDGVLKANTFARQAEVKAWEQEITPCEHTLCLEQDTGRHIDSQDLVHCSMCDLKENLWLCLQCGNLGCGRAQFGGSRGNSHGLEHFNHTSHAVAVKLGSITSEGTADIYCYACKDERTDPELATHLAHWGINIAEREKTEKSLTELQIEQNLKWEFSMTSEDGKELTPIFGKGFTGLKNLGNSCYLASILQCLFSMPEFANRYFLPQDLPPSTSKPAEDLETQLRKVADGLLSGRYSIPDTDVIASEDSPYVPHQKGLAPSMLKHLVGQGHEEFSTMRQQDAFELLLHLFKLVTRSPHIGNLQDPVDSFRFVMEQRLQCISCNRVRYSAEEQENISVPVPVRRKLRVVNSDETDGNKSKDEFEPVTLKECLDIFTGAEEVELTCPSCGSKAGFTKRSLFKTFPTVLAVNARRFELINWVPTKLDIPVVVGDKPFDLNIYKSAGQQDGEELLPDDAQAATGFVPNQAALSELEAMGFPRVRCEKALHATSNIDADAAMNWILAHMDDPNVDTPANLGSTSSSTANATRSVNPESVEMLVAMGINAPQARKALKETSGDMERAVDWVFSHPDDQGDFEGEGTPQDKHSATREDRGSLAGSAELPARFRLQSIVCHKGTSIHAGHYVAFIRKHIPEQGQEAWVLFNDEKVVKAADVEEMKKFAYVYFFGRTTVQLKTTSGLRYSDSSNEHSAPLLAKSTQGATYLILLQIGSRALTFLVNQVLLRYLSPDLLGISTQLDLYSTSVLYFARESLRVALQRQASGTRSPKLKENGEDQRKQKTAKSYDEFEKIQEAVNLSYIAIGLGVPLACIFGYLYFRSADAAVLRTPFIRESLITYTVSTMLELVSEPCFIVSQQQMLYGTRASAESLATFTRCILTCASAIWASRSNMGLGALPFAIGQLSYAIVLNLVYQFKIMHLSTQKNFSLLPKRVNSPSPTLTLSYFSTPHITLASNLYAQSVFKHLLTTGDALLIAALTSLESQGAYTLAANYGGLLARTIFQPIEESSRSLFGRLLPSQAPRQPPLPPSTPPPPTQRPTQPSRETLQASSYLLYILRLYTLLSLPLLALAPPLCPTFLSFLAGPRWRNTAAPGVLAAYVYYIPLLAVNGILEAYVAATATPHQLRAQSVAMVGFSAAMGVTGWLSLRVWRWGARGLVVSNAVGMAVRIAWSWGFVGRDLEERGVLVVGKGVLPRWQTAVVSLVAGWVMRGLNLEIEKGWGGLWRAVGVVGGYGVTLMVLERHFLWECYSMLRPLRGQRDTGKKRQ